MDSQNAATAVSPSAHRGHVCLVAWAYPPSSATGGLRALALSRWLLESGYRVTVVSADPITYEAFFQTDESLLAHVPAAVRMVRTDFTPEPMNPLLNSWPDRRIRHPLKWTREQAEKDRERFPENVYPAWIPTATAALFEIHDEDPISLVVATAAPYSGFGVAANFNETTGVPFILDDRDSFLHDVFTGDVLPDYPARRILFEDYLNRVTSYWCVNDAIRAAMRDEAVEGADRIITVPNGWDSYALPTLADDIQPSDPSGPGPIFLFVGTVTPTFPAELTASAWSGFHREIPQARLLIAGGIGYRKAKKTDASKTLEQTPGIELLGRVQRSELSHIYSLADALFFVKEGGPMVTSSKIYEYIATGLPIAALGAADVGARIEISDYPRVHWGDLADPVSGTRALVAAAADAAHSPALAHHSEQVLSFNRATTFEREAAGVISGAIGS